MSLSSVADEAVVPFTIRGHLTRRELEILQLLADGCTVEDVGAALHVAHGTVRSHVTRLYLKLGAHNRAGAIANAMRAGVIS